MAKARIELNRAGVRELLKSAEMQSVCREQALSIMGRCGDGYDMDTRVGKNRAVAQVWASTVEAKRDNSSNNTILKAVRG